MSCFGNIILIAAKIVQFDKTNLTSMIFFIKFDCLNLNEVKTKFDPSERKFAIALKNGRLYAFEYFFEKYSKVLFHFSYKLLKSRVDAEEIVQNVFLKIWEKRSQVNPEQPFRPYLFTIALNDIRKSFIEKAKREMFKVELFDFLVEQANDSDEELNFGYYLKLLDQEIDRLPEKRRAVFLLLKKEGLTVNEAANFLNVSPKTVENQLTAAIKTIRDSFFEKKIRNLYLFFTQLQNVGTKQHA